MPKLVTDFNLLTKPFSTSVLLLIAFAVLTLATPMASAKTGYVSDVLYVPLRSGKGNQYRIINSALKSGIQLEILDSDDEWLHVRTPGGTEGYIPAQYVIDEPTAKLKLAQTQAELNRVLQANEKLKSENQELTASNQSLNNTISTTTNSANQTAAELEEIKRLSAGAIDLNERHQDLVHAHQMLQTELDVMKAEISRYQKDASHKWFIYGAAAVLLGVVITLVVPMFKVSKRKSEWLN